jgi:hypothetical protein
MLVNQIAHDRRLRTAKSFRALLQQRDVLPIHFQCDCFHAGKVLSSWQQVNTDTVAVLDDRILMKQRGRAFLVALPKCPVEVV